MGDSTFTPGPTPDTVRTPDGQILSVPEGWVLLPPGDPALTRRVKAAGEHWVVQEKKGRKLFSRGVWDTTGYDDMVIPRVKGKRREVRRVLAARSKELLSRYRIGEPVPEGCPLKKALAAVASGQRDVSDVSP